MQIIFKLLNKWHFKMTLFSCRQQNTYLECLNKLLNQLVLLSAVDSKITFNYNHILVGVCNGMIYVLCLVHHQRTDQTDLTINNVLLEDEGIYACAIKQMEDDQMHYTHVILLKGKLVS